MGPVLEGTVLGAFSQAVIVGLRTESGPRVVSLLARGAAAVPNGVRLSGAETDLHRVQVGAPVLVGAGWVRAGSFEVRVVRSWNSRVPVIDPEMGGLAALVGASGAAERGVPQQAINRLEGALQPSVGADRHNLEGAVQGLVGLGRGLTPGGDDLLAGVLTGLHAVGRADAAATIGGLTLPRITERTTLLSADLLRLAAAGHACLEALALLRAMHRPGSAHAAMVSGDARPPVMGPGGAGPLVTGPEDAGPATGPGGAGPPVTAAIDRLLSIGHTSGADLATGLAIGLTLGLGSDRGSAVATAGQGVR
jgi:hypothetical protein